MYDVSTNIKATENVQIVVKMESVCKPRSLEDLCLDSITDFMCKMVEDDEMYHSPPEWWQVHDWGSNMQTEGLKFRDPYLFIINNVSEKILHRFQEKRPLVDPVIGLFTSKHTRLRRVKLSNALITVEGCRMLKDHRIKDLEVINMNFVTIGEILDCLGVWSQKWMKKLVFRHCNFVNMSRYCLMVKITHFHSLRYLSVAYSEVNQEIFAMICEDLRNLEKLDISGTKLTDLTPLSQMEKLRALTISDLPNLKNVNTAVENMDFHYLDMSIHIDKVEKYDLTFNPNKILQNFLTFPNILYLDLSGWRDTLNADILIAFMKAHPKIEFLGLALTSFTFDPFVCESKLNIAGLGTEEHIIETLKKYWDRFSYVQKALYYLFQLTNRFKDPRPDLFDLVLPHMEHYPSKFGVQMAATACLYNLTRGDLSKHINAKTLGRAVRLTLVAMKTFPDEFQLQKNSLLILCSDRILQEVDFDRFKCAKLVLDALCGYDDLNMSRMAVAICGILAAKVTTEETSFLGAKKLYMQKLLSMVQSRVESGVSDITLKFTLSTLWNLTDESSTTCSVFLEQDGALLFLNVLWAFKDESAIETKVLGLLNNISEVPGLRHHLMQDALVTELVRLLYSKNIDVSYFAAGIVAHLASEGQERWCVPTHQRKDMLVLLESAVNDWKDPDGEMVAYRSFRPFYPLLDVDMDYQIQLWALWAMHHVCTKNPKRYVPMMHDEGGHEYLANLMTSPDTHARIRSLTTRIMDIREAYFDQYQFDQK